ncbi:MAG: KEOPS complex subunit Pcc1 [Candidatus ainarchaeum sp.]|nr:KEOPS complex subunit Pcc1 [Candidatus ainarchaeum sp.]
MKGSIQLIINFPDEISAKNAKTALDKEVSVAENQQTLLKSSSDLKINTNKRFSSEITYNKDKLVITVNAEDMVSLRATANSYLRYLQVMEKI